MRYLEISISFVLHGKIADKIRAESGTDAEADLYADSLGVMFLGILEKLRQSGVHPEILEIAVKRFRVDLDEVKKVLYANLRSQT
jgi:hypothetical protein